MTDKVGGIVAHVAQEGLLSWVRVTVNGRWTHCPIHTASVEEAKKIQVQARELAEEVYQMGYKDGFSACGKTIRDAIGE